MSSIKRSRIECEITYTDYVIELLMDKFKDMFATPEKRILLITQYLINTGTDPSTFQVIPLYEQSKLEDETNNDKQLRINKELYTYIKEAIAKYRDKRYIITGIRDIPNPDTEETHFTGLIINNGTKKVYYFDTAGGEYSANDVTTIAIQKLAKSLAGIKYKFVDETDMGETCQVVPHDTFCQTWSAYYTIGKVLNPRFGIELAKHARLTTNNTDKKIRRLFNVFKELTTNIPDIILNELANEYMYEVKYDRNIPAGIKVLYPKQIQNIFTSYFSNDENMNGFVRLVEMPPIDDCRRILIKDSLKGFTNIISTNKGGFNKRYNKTRKVSDRKN
jgi:hypothetical protein